MKKLKSEEVYWWEARLELDQHFMNIQVQDCPYDEAERLVQRQNVKYAEEFGRPLYKLVSLERVSG